MAMPTLLKARHSFEKEVVPRADIVATRKKKSLIKDSIAGHLADTLIQFLLGQLLTDSTLLECYFLITEHISPPTLLPNTFTELSMRGKREECHY